ncbi:hypothetical protein FB446DRAFT_526756 [Lentinula raphanica]|nr:hypothetical protein FB446DRAFT_526756 [Lentinula raphanica]
MRDRKEILQNLKRSSIFQMREGISLADATKSSDTPKLSPSPAVKTFEELCETIKTQKGFIRQYWGQQVEDPTLFVWCIDWESSDHHEAFANSEGYNTYTTALERIFDFIKAAPLTTFTKWSSDPTPALKAPVTEIAFLTLPDSSPEDTKRVTEEALGPILSDVQKIGKAWGAALGWVSKTTPAIHEAAPEGHHIALHGVFGYASIEDHMKWRETQEHTQAVETMEELATRVHLDSADIHGADMFHVAFYYPNS